MTTIFILLVLFQLKHFIADYPLQRPYMLKKFLPDWGFVLPLLAHTGVHAVMTFGIASMFTHWKMALDLAIFDLVVHFGMDRMKASPKYLGKFKALSGNEVGVILNRNYLDLESDEIYHGDKAKLKGNTLFWWSLGLDQMVHHLTHYVIIWFLV